MTNNVKLTKRIMALVLTLCMMLSSMAGYVPGWFTAFAEDSAVEVPTSGESAAPAEGQEEAPAKEETPVGETAPAEEALSPLGAEGLAERQADQPEAETEEAPADAASASDETEKNTQDDSDEAAAEAESSSEETSSVTADAVTQGAFQPDLAENSPLESFPGAAVSPEGKAFGEETVPAEEEAPAEDAPVEENANIIEETPAEEAVPAEEAPVEEAPVEENTDAVEETSVEETPTEEAEEPADEEVVAAEAPAAEEVTMEVKLAAAPVPAQSGMPADESTQTLTTQIYTDPVILAAEVPAEGTEEKTVSVVQTKINEALAAVTGKLTGRIQVLLTRGTVYDGEVSISKEEIGREVDDDFELEITEEEADEPSAVATPAVYTGTMTIKGINVAIRGIGLLGMVNVEGAKLSYVGTAAADAVNVTAGEGSNVDIQTGEGGDTVTVTATGAAVSVDSGADADTVNVTANGGSADIKTGEGDDTVTATANAASVSVDTGAGDDTATVNVTEGTGTVKTGAGNDTVTATLSGSQTAASLSVDTSEGDDTVKLTDDAAQGTVTIATGAGNDNLEVDAHTAGNGNITVNTGADDDTVTLKSTGSAANPYGKLIVELGTGNNLANVDVALSTAVTEVLLSGQGADSNAVNFTGTLASVDKDADQVTVEGAVTKPEDVKKIEFKASNGKTLAVSLSNFNNITDSLGNKKTIELAPVDGVLDYTAEKPFVNYKVTVPAKDIKNLKVSSKDGAYLPLSNLLINTATEVDGANKLVIGEGTVIDIRGLNLTLDSSDIEVNGTIVAENVNMTANAGGNFVNVSAATRIVITDKAAIYTSGDVMIIAKVTMAGPMLDANALVGAVVDIAPINSINIKIAHASVDIAGKVYAGVTNLDAIAGDLANANPEFGAAGNVTVKTETSVSMGVDEKGKPRDSGWPVAVSVASVGASINVAKTAVIEAANDITLAAKSTLKAGTRASSGFVGAPASAAVAVLTNDASTTVDGKVNAHNGDVKITADGTLEATTVADRGSGQSIISGGYAAVTVALQDVKAIVGSGATVKAGGNVTVDSNAVEKVVDKAAAASLSEQKDDGGDSGILGTVKEKVGDLLGSLKDKLIAKFTGSGKIDKKLKKALKMLPVSDKSVTLDSKAQSKGQASADVETVDGTTKVKVSVEPWEGYEVKSVMLRGYLPGENFWSVKTLSKDEIAGKKELELDPVGNNMIVYVEYEEKQGASDDDWQPSDLFGDKDDSQDDDELDEDTWRPSDLFDLDDVIGGVQDGTNGADGEKSEGTVKLELGGGVLTYDFLPGSPDKNLEKVNPGDALRLIPNPASGQKLARLKATYFVKEKVEKDGKEEEKDVEKNIDIVKDAQGRYIFNVPETFIEDKGVKITAEFTDGAQEKDADQSQTQVTGTVAVSVANNDSQAMIDKDATVVSGGIVDVASDIKTDVNTYADGSSVSKADVTEPGPAAPPSYPISRAEKEDVDGYASDGSFMYGIKVGETINGKVTFEQAKDKDGKPIPYTYVFTPSSDYEGYEAASATLTYYQGGEAHTVSLKKGEDGKYTVALEKSLMGSVLDYYTLKDDCYNKVETGKLDTVVSFVKNLIGSSLGIDKGSTITVNFAFASKDEAGVVKGIEAGQAVSPYIIGIKYNKLKGDDNAITYEAKEVDSEAYFVFSANADASKGYSLKDDKLTATWEGGSAELTKKEDGKWYLKAADLPENVKVTVAGEFAEDFHDFKKAENIQGGTVTLYDAKVKKSDAPKFTVKPDANYSVNDIEITYTKVNALGQDETVTLKLTDKDSKITQAKDKDKKEIADVYTFTVDDMKAGSEITVNAKFVRKTIRVYAGNDNADVGKYQVSESNVASGDKVTVSLNDADVMAGKKITEVKVEVQGKPDVTVKVNDDGSFEVPEEGVEGSDKIVITSVTIVDKEMALQGATLEHGSVAPNVPYADRGDTVTVTVKPEDNYKIKKGTLKAVFKSDDGTYTEEVIMRRQSDTSYAFTMPNIADDKMGKVKLTFEGEFEPGQSDSSKVETSVGAGIAVSVVGSEGRAYVKGGVSGTAVVVNSASAGNVATESKAGYSAGNTGIGGAVSVQVASVDSKALVHEGASVEGGLGVVATNNADYSVSADASGSKEAGKTGVGAGIAVAVNGADAYAAVNDGVKLNKIPGISLSADQTVKDVVAAKAGASGGNAGVPVAAVDVTGGSAQAYLGRRVGGALLDVAGTVAVSASNIASHAISSDASAAGKGVGVGAAINVSVVSDKANARLNQGVNAAGGVAVKSENESILESTATASASGGLTSDKGGENPDNQADGLLGMAGKLAGMNGSDSVSQGDIEGAKSENRQKAETSEGSVAVAGAIAVNVQNSQSRSEVMGGVDVKTAGALAVTALNGTTAKVKANASTTKSNVGVGVGVAVNVIGLTNIASISDGEIEAAMLKLAANTKMTDPNAEAEAAAKAAAEAEAAAAAAMSPAEAAVAAQKAAEELAKEKAKETLSSSVSEAVNGFVRSLIKSMGLDSYVSASLIGDITSRVAEEATQAIIKTMGLEETLGAMTFGDVVNAAKASLEEITKQLQQMPEEMEGPVGDAIDNNAGLTKEALAALTDEQKQQLKQVLGDEVDLTDPASVKEALLALIEQNYTNEIKGQLPELPTKLMAGAKEGLVGYISQNMGGIVSGLFAGKDGDAMNTLTAQAGQRIMASVSGQVQQLMAAAMEKAVMGAAEKVMPILPEVDFEAIVTEAIKDDGGEGQEGIKEASDKTAQQVTDVFGENMPYKDMLEKLKGGDFKTKITDSIRAAAKAALVTLSNESLNALSEHFDLALEAVENPATGHVIETQAISGAGAKDVGVAGSIAVTVLNADTKAAVAGSGKALKVSGDMTVAADEQRSVTNVASAAVNAAGDAMANLGAGAEENKQVGGGDEANSIATNEYGTDKKQTVKLTVGVGGTAEIYQADKIDNRPKAYITLKEGYRLPDGNAVSYVVKDEDGKEAGKGTVTAAQEGDKWVVDTKAGDLAGVNAKYTIELEVKPVEILHAVNAPSVNGVDAGAVSVSVKDRKTENGQINARVGELVQITVDREKAKGYKVGIITYTVNGQKFQVMLDKESEPLDANSKKAFAVAGSNEKELTYTFMMPDGDISNLQLTFEEAEGSDSDTAATDGSGNSVGVGASFSMVYGNSDVTADVGSRNVTAGALSVTADSAHAETVASVAGTDPIGASLDADAIKNTAVDASVALNILDNDILAQVNEAAKVTTKGYEAPEMDEAGNAVGTTPVAGDLKVAASETSIDSTVASAFAAGASTAVGASVAINIAGSTAQALLKGGATVAGSATVAATGTSADVTRAVATALGADIARGLMKLNMGAQVAAAGANSLLNGSATDNFLKGDDKPKGTDTNKNITEKLNAKKGEKGEEADESLSLSQNVLRSQGVETQSEDAGSEGTQEAMDQARENTEEGGSLNDVGNETSTKIQVGAAVGVNVTKHEMLTQVGAIEAAGDISAIAQNTANFQTQGTGAAMSFAEKANSIAIGVAVSVNSNKANVDVTGNLISTNGGDVNASTKLTQNLTDDFAGKLATQAVSGSVAGKDSGISLGGAVSVLVSNGSAEVNVSDGTSRAHRKLEGGSVTVESIDKSRLTSRAGGISLSRGSSVGMGIASNVVVSNNHVTAAVGNYAEVTAGSFKLNAEKQAVTDEDFKQLVNLRTLVTDSSNLTDEQRANAQTGLIDYHKTTDKDGKESYQANVNLSSDRLLGVMDGLNFLSGRNTYVEAIAGSVSTGSSSLNLAGSIAVATSSNVVKATLGTNAKVTLTKSKDRDGSMTVNAENGTTTRVIAGSISAAPASAAVGATVAVLVDSDEVTASTGNNSTIKLAGDFTHTAATTGDISVFTGAMGVAAGTTGGSAVGGAVNVIVTKNKTNNTFGNAVTVESTEGSANIGARTAFDLMTISGSANVGKGAVAAGGTVNVIVDKSEAHTTLGERNTVTAANNVNVTSDVSTQFTSGTASLSVAATTSGASGAGVVNVIVSKSVADTSVGRNTTRNATLNAGGDLNVTANNDAWMLNAGVALAGGGMALGGAFNINVFNRTAKVDIGQGNTSGTVNNLIAGRNLVVQASGRDTDIMAGLSVAGGITGLALSGNVVVGVMNSNIQNVINGGVTAHAGGSAIVESYYSGYDLAAAGNVAISGTSPAVGATVVTMVRNNAVTTELATSHVTADGDNAVKSLSGKDVSGVYVGANAGEQQYLAAAGIAAAGSATVNGVVAVLVNTNKVTADAHQASLTAKAADIAVAARDDTHQLVVAGGLSASLGVGAGAAVTTLVSNKNIEAVGLNMSAKRDVSVSADNSDDITQLSVSAGISAGTAVQIGAAVQVLKSRAVAQVGNDRAATAKVSAETGRFSLTSSNDAKLTNNAVTAAGSLGAAITPVGVVTYFQGEAEARLRKGAVVNAARDININANSAKEIGLSSIGAAAGSVGISGTVNVMVSKDKTRAIAETGTTLTATGNGKGAAESDDKTDSINIEAINDYRLDTVSAAVGAGAVGVAVNAVVSVLKSNVTAEMGGTASAVRNVNVKADSTRRVTNAVASLAAGATGVGVNVMVLVAGTKMSQDAADMIAYGNASDKSQSATFDASTFLGNVEKGSAASKYYNGADETDEDRKLTGDILAKDLAGNGHHESENSVGGTTTVEAKTVKDKDGNDVKPANGGNQRTGTFDASSGYMDKDLDYLKENGDGKAPTAFSDSEHQGENLQAKDSADVAAAKELNTYTYDNEPSDQVVARITTTGRVVMAEGVNVIANQRASADLFGAVVGAGAVGVGVGAAVAVLHSNVTASSVGYLGNVGKKDENGNLIANDKKDEDGNPIVDGSNGISVRANSVSGDAIIDGDVAARYDEIKKDKSLVDIASEDLDKLNPANSAIRAVGVAVGAGAVGVAVGASVVYTDNVTQAILGGHVNTNGNTEVVATHNYGNVLAATLGVSAGGVAAGASVAVAQANGRVNAEITKDAANGDKGSHIETRNLTVKTDTAVNVNSIAATAGAGGVSVNAGVSLALNRLEQTAHISEGAKVTAKGDLTMTSTSRTTADSQLLGVSFGGVGAALGAAVSDLDAKVVSAIDKSDVNVAGKLKVKNDVTSAAAPKVLSVAAGAAGIAGNVLLAFNNSKSQASIENSTIKAGSMDVISDLAGTGESSIAALAAGGLAVGVSVNYVDLRAENVAAVRGGTVDVDGDLNVLTGAGSHRDTDAIAETVTASVGALSVGLNTAIARNNTKNNAILTGIEKLKVGKALTVNAGGNATANASLTGLEIGLATASAAVVVSMNDAYNVTQVSAHDVTVGGMSTFNSTQNATTDSVIRTGGGSLIGLNANVAMAYGRANSIVDVTLEDATGLQGGITAMNRAGDATSARVYNLANINLIAAKAMVGIAYSQDVYNTTVRLKGNSEVTGDVNINTSYMTTSTADVTPSTSGIDVSLASVAVNIGLARNTAYAGATLESSANGGKDSQKPSENTITGNLNISTDGYAVTDAIVRPSELTVNALGIGTNIVKTELAATQASQVVLGGDAANKLVVTGDLDVQSRANRSYRMRQILYLLKAEGNENLKTVDIDKLTNDKVEEYYNANGGALREKREVLKQLRDGGEQRLAYIDIDALPEKTIDLLYDVCGGPQMDAALISNARLGTSGMKDADSIKVSLVNVTVNSAKAKEQMDSTAAIIGSAVDKSKIEVGGSMGMFAGVKEGVKTAALSRTDGAMEFSLVSIGSLDGAATSNDNFNVALRGVDVTVAGAADFKARSDTSAYGHGTSPGGFKLIKFDRSTITAGIGDKTDKETTKILLDDGVKLTANTVNMEALNQGATEAFYKSDKTISVASVATSSQPTTSYYDTGVSIGKNAVVTALGNPGAKENALNIATETMAKAKSDVSAQSIAIGFNVSIMEGTNYIYDDNIINIAENATLQSDGSMNIQTTNNTDAWAMTDLKNIALFDGTDSTTTNTISRVGRINIKDGVTMKSDNGGMNVLSIAGTADRIYTNATADSGGGVAVGTAFAKTDLESENSINIGQDVHMTAAGDMNLTARSTSHQADGEIGIENRSYVDAAGLGVDALSTADLKMLFHTQVNINKGGNAADHKGTFLKVTSTEKDPSINIQVDNEGLTASNDAFAKGGGLVGKASATASTNANLQNVIWVDRTDLQADSRVYLLATNAAENAKKPVFTTKSQAELTLEVGTEESIAQVIGDAHNQIRTNERNLVNGGDIVDKDQRVIQQKFFHIAMNPEDTIDHKAPEALSTKSDATVEAKIYWEQMKYRCDFCGEGSAVDPSDLIGEEPTGEEKAPANTRGTTATKAFKKALQAISTVEAQSHAALSKGLIPLTNLEAGAANATPSFKAHYGEEESKAASKIFVLDVKSVLQKDVTLDAQSLGKYRVWNNAQTQHDVTLLPNATRLFTRGGLDYVSEVFTGDVYGDGRFYAVEIYSALNDAAAANPVIPIGSMGSLDFNNGIFTVPARSDFELYLYEVSSAWLLDRIDKGQFRWLDADQDQINSYVMEEEGAELPDGRIVETLIEDAAVNAEGIKRYWLGDTPETASDDAQNLVYLLVDPATDEVDAFRTSRAMIAAGEQDIDVSLMIYRDSKSDRMGEEKYNLIFFDTPKGTESEVAVITNVLEGRELEIHKTLRVVLRSFQLDGADHPVYGLSGHLFTMEDATDGTVEMFDDTYVATFDGDVFDSAYTRIEGISSDNLNTIIKKDQGIWPEWTGEAEAEDIQGYHFIKSDDDTWTQDYPELQESAAELSEDAVAA